MSMAIASSDISQKLDIIAKEADDFSLGFTVALANGNPFDFTGVIAELLVKTARKEGLPDILYFSSASNPASIVLSAGSLLISASKATLMNKSGKYVYDLYITKNNKTTTWLFGDFIIKPKTYSIAY